jgi:ketoreductase
MTLTGRTALITGGARGIGRAIATAYLQAGASIFITAQSDNGLKEGIASLECEARKQRPGNGVHVSGGVVDVRDQGAVDKLVDKAINELGEIDVLVNNAGRGGGGPTLDAQDKLWFDVIDVNLHGTYRMTRAILSRSNMLKRKWGRIINMASTGGKQGVLLAAAYTASKHGVVGFSKSLGLELAKSGVTVNAICPGFVETDLSKTARAKYAEAWKIEPDEVLRRFEARIPIGRYVTPEEVAPLAVFLAQESSAPITAQAINVCGGLGNY